MYTTMTTMTTMTTIQIKMHSIDRMRINFYHNKDM